MDAAGRQQTASVQAGKVGRLLRETIVDEVYHLTAIDPAFNRSKYRARDALYRHNGNLAPVFDQKTQTTLYDTGIGRNQACFVKYQSWTQYRTPIAGFRGKCPAQYFLP